MPRPKAKPSTPGIWSKPYKFADDTIDKLKGWGLQKDDIEKVSKVFGVYLAEKDIGHVTAGEAKAMATDGIRIINELMDWREKVDWRTRSYFLEWMIVSGNFLNEEALNEHLSDHLAAALYARNNAEGEKKTGLSGKGGDERRLIRLVARILDKRGVGVSSSKRESLWQITWELFHLEGQDRDPTHLIKQVLAEPIWP